MHVYCQHLYAQQIVLSRNFELQVRLAIGSQVVTAVATLHFVR